MTKNYTFDFEGFNECNKEKARMYQIPVYKVMLVKDSAQAAYKTTIRRPTDIFDLAKRYLEGADREHFVVIMLDVKNSIIGINTVSIGVLNASLVHPREVFKPAIIAGSASIILVHNHPSGDPAPSQDDLMLTDRLRDAGELLGINVTDHVIIGDDRYVSLKERGQI